MALIKCSECSKEVSDKAGNCPHCGNPINQSVVQDLTNPDRPVQLEIQLTSRKWKRVMLIAVLVIVAGFIVPAFLPGDLGVRQGFGWTIVFFGFVGLIIGKVGAWYSNR